MVNGTVNLENLVGSVSSRKSAQPKVKKLSTALTLHEKNYFSAQEILKADRKDRLAIALEDG